MKYLANTHYEELIQYHIHRIFVKIFYFGDSKLCESHPSSKRHIIIIPGYFKLQPLQSILLQPCRITHSSLGGLGGSGVLGQHLIKY